MAETHTEAQAGHPQKPSYDDINSPVIFLVGIISAILTFLTIAFVEGLYYHWEASLVNHDVPSRQTAVIQQQKDRVVAGPADGYIEFDQAVNDVLKRYANANGQTGAAAANGDAPGVAEPNSSAANHDDQDARK